jgi:hypothetical protein
MSSVQNDLILGEGCNSAVYHVVLRDKEIGEARHVSGTSIVLQRRYAFYNLLFSF